MIIRAEAQMDGNWIVQDEYAILGEGRTRSAAIARARLGHPAIMERFPLQPDEIPGELREIAKRMFAVGHGVAACKTLESGWPTAEAMTRWSESVAAWADDLEPLAFPPPGA